MESQPSDQLQLYYQYTMLYNVYTSVVVSWDEVGLGIAVGLADGPVVEVKAAGAAEEGFCDVAVPANTRSVYS